MLFPVLGAAVSIRRSVVRAFHECSIAGQLFAAIVQTAIMDETAWTVLPAAQGGIMVESDESSQAGLLHHVEIYCADLKVKTDFWGWFLGLLGYSVYQDWPGGRSYRLGPTYLVFVQAERRFCDEPVPSLSSRSQPSRISCCFAAAGRRGDRVAEESGSAYSVRGSASVCRRARLLRRLLRGP